ncbi:MAG TPA: hypothetical protein VJN89_10340 [Candidatus Acidoferrum sp.]|nr:hypothetical protein [Candidatus Acidoferrum sp.]
MKDYHWIKLPTLTVTFSRQHDMGGIVKAVDFNDPSLPDDIIDIDPDADAFANGALDDEA